MSENHPFKLRDHGNKIMEIIVYDQDIKSDHKSIETLKLLGRKFPQLILTLEENATLNLDVLPELLKIGEFGGLKIVAPVTGQIPFDLHGIRSFNDIFAAIKRISGERISEKILKQLGTIGPMKSSAYNLLQMMRNPDVAFEDIEAAASLDPNLVIRMLKNANTGYLSRRIPVETLKGAVTYLGLEGIRQLLVHEMFGSFTQFFSNQRDKLSHMLRCSHLAAYIGTLIKVDIPTIGKMRVAGLLHDLGSLAFSFYDSDEYRRVLSMVRRERLSTFEAEMRVFGVTHNELGALYAREMGLPDYVISVIENHHNTEIDKDDFVLMSVICANGFLNDKIEQMRYTKYEPYFKYLADEIDSKNPALKKASQEEKEQMDPTSLDEDEVQEEVTENSSDLVASDQQEKPPGSFKSMQFFGLMKEELDQFMLSGAGSQGV